MICACAVDECYSVYLTGFVVWKNPAFARMGRLYIVYGLSTVIVNILTGIMKSTKVLNPRRNSNI